MALTQDQKKLISDYIFLKLKENGLDITTPNFLNYVLDNLDEFKDLATIQIYMDNVDLTIKQNQIDGLIARLKELDPTLDVVKK